VLSYLDTSFLIKLYVPEPGTAEAIATSSRLTGRVAISKLTDVEMASALHRRLPVGQADIPYQEYLRDRAAGIFQEFVLNDRVFALAGTLAELHAYTFLLRSLDILHLATALHSQATNFGTFDRRLAKAATALGLQVVP